MIFDVSEAGPCLPDVLSRFPLFLSRAFDNDDCFWSRKLSGSTDSGLDHGHQLGVVVVGADNQETDVNHQEDTDDGHREEWLP